MHRDARLPRYRWVAVALAALCLDAGCGDLNSAADDQDLCEQAEAKRFECLIDPEFNCRTPLSPEQRCVVSDCILAETVDCGSLEDDPLLTCAAECYGNRPLPCGAGDESYVAFERCDGTSDCKNAADEQGCFVCLVDSRTDPPTVDVTNPLLECNGTRNCDNGADEQDCFSCEDDTTIPKRWLCDGILDCGGGLDEAECETFDCGDGSSVPIGLRCNNVSDCPTRPGDGASGAAGAASTELSADEASCETSRCADGTAFPLELDCDRIGQCSAYEDEIGCPR